MIKSLKITDLANVPLSEENIQNAPWLSDLGGKKLVFGDEVTFLCGANGTGKTSLLKMVADYFHCREGGVPRVTQSSILKIVPHNPLAEAVWGEKAISPMNGCEFDCDGSPVFFVSGALHEKRTMNDDFGLERLLKKVDPYSGGEGNMRDFNYLIKQARETHEVDTHLVDGMSDKWKKLAKKALFAYGNGRKKKIKPTVILDEVEANLDALNQMFFFKILFEQVAQWTQVIFTSHSVLAFMQAYAQKNVTVLETEKGYFESTIRELQQHGFSFDGIPRKGGARKARK